VCITRFVRNLGVDSENELILIGVLCGAHVASPPVTGNALSITIVVLYRGHPARIPLSRKPVSGDWLALSSAGLLFDK
jgi:hypothetical protein